MTRSARLLTDDVIASTSMPPSCWSRNQSDGDISFVIDLEIGCCAYHLHKLSVLNIKCPSIRSIFYTIFEMIRFSIPSTTQVRTSSPELIVIGHDSTEPHATGEVNLFELRLLGHSISRQWGFDLRTPISYTYSSTTTPAKHGSARCLVVHVA